MTKFCYTASAERVFRPTNQLGHGNVSTEGSTCTGSGGVERYCVGENLTQAFIGVAAAGTIPEPGDENGVGVESSEHKKKSLEAKKKRRKEDRRERRQEDKAKEKKKKVLPPLPAAIPTPAASGAAPSGASTMDGASAAVAVGLGASAAVTASPAGVQGGGSSQQEQDGAASRRVRQSTPDQIAVVSTSESLHRAMVLLHEIELNVMEFSIHQQLNLMDRINFFVTELMSMQAASSACNFQIPFEVISFLDEGRNPEQYTRDLLDTCVQRNQATKGKVDAFKDLRKNLLDEIDGAFPEETEAFRQMRSADLAESRRLRQSYANTLSNGDVKVKTEH